MTGKSLPRFAIAVLGVCGFAAPASAHHMMNGEMPSTLLQGLLSGLGHPVIGPDHLAFIVAIGIAAALLPAGAAMIAAFIAASTLGVLAHVLRLDVPMTEPLIAMSVVAAGAMIALGRGVAQPAWLLLAVAAGLLHGYAFGESIVGAERTVVGAYLVGIALVASLIASAVMQVTARVAASDASAMRLRGAGALVGLVGVVLLAGSLVSF